LVYYLFSFFIAAERVVLLIKYENNGFLCVAELGGPQVLFIAETGY